MSSSYQNDMDDKRCFQRGSQMYNVWPLADEVHGAGLECLGVSIFCAKSLVLAQVG